MTRSIKATCWWTRAARMEQSSTETGSCRYPLSPSVPLGCGKNTLRIPSSSSSRQPKTKCEPHALMHGDEVKMGDTVLSFHIHSGTDTCDGCEPGQVMAHLSKHRREEKTTGEAASGVAGDAIGFWGHCSTLPLVPFRPGAFQRRQGGPSAEGAEADESQVRFAGKSRRPLSSTISLLSVRLLTLCAFWLRRATSTRMAKR